MRRFALLLLLIPFTIFAQSDDSPIIMPGESLSLTVTTDNRANATFAVDESQYITIQVDSASDEFDPVVWIVDSENRLRAYNNNSADSNASRIENLFLSPDSYTIFVDSFNGVSEGNVELRLDSTTPFEDDLTNLDNITMLTVNLPEDLVYRYALEISEDETLTITARDLSRTLDPYLVLRDSQNTILASNDDHQSDDFNLNSFDARLSAVQMPSDGIIFIEVHDFIGNAGQFELIIETQA